MNEGSCENWRGAIALEALGNVPEGEKVALYAHAEGCTQCSTTLEDLRGINNLLSLVDRARIDEVELMSSRFVDRTLGTIRASARHSRRRQIVRRSLVGASGLVAASLIALMLVASLATSPAPTTRVLALHGTSAASATVHLSARSWGTALTLDESGLSAGGQYTVSMKTASGRWWIAGTYKANGGTTSDVTMACPVDLNQITGVRIQNANGNTVLSSYV